MARAAEVEKMKQQMMQVMNITDEKEFQRIARDYCKEMAADLSLPAYHRIATRMSKIVMKDRQGFDKLHNGKEKVAQLLKLAMDDVEVVDTFKMALEQEDKEAQISPELSTDKRNAGNASFQKKKDTEALDLYSEAAMASLVTTEAGRKDAALALANRSAVWVRMGRYKEGLDDLEALQYFEYPANILYKPVDRQAKCLAALGRIEEASTAYNRVILLLKQSNLDTAKQEAWKKDVLAELEKLKTAPIPEVGKPEVDLLPRVNPRVPQFADCVEVQYSPLVGRHGVATRDIEVGEVVMVDTATSVHTLCGSRLSNCTNCTVRLAITKGKPSPHTVTARFCSTACLKAGMDSYHPVEARINIEKLFWNRKEDQFEETSGNIFLTLRSITQKPLEFFMNWKDFTQPEPTFGAEFTSPEDVCHYSDYRNIANLEGHRDRQSNDEALGVTINAVILLVLLREGGYFGKKETSYGGCMSSQETVLASILIHLQEGLRYNLHTVNEVVSTNMTGLSMPQTKETGTALFPTLLLLNHSCDTNTLRLNVNGNQVMMVAKRSIKAGEEVTDNYGIHHLSYSLDERQEKLLKGFCFCCWCNACQKDFPRMKSLRTQLPEDVEDKYDRMREDIKELFRKGLLSDCLKTSLNMVKLLEAAVIPMPHRNYEMAGLGLLSCLWRLYGNKGEEETARRR